MDWSANDMQGAIGSTGDFAFVGRILSNGNNTIYSVQTK
jgi:hypothetical protein